MSIHNIKCSRFRIVEFISLKALYTCWYLDYSLHKSVARQPQRTVYYAEKKFSNVIKVTVKSQCLVAVHVCPVMILLLSNYKRCTIKPQSDSNKTLSLYIRVLIIPLTVKCKLPVFTQLYFS